MTLPSIVKRSPILILTAMILTCGNKSSIASRDPLPVAAVLLFVIGDVRSEGTALKAGDIVDGGKYIETGPNSSCDLQLRGPEAGVAIRLQANTKLSVRGFQSGSEKTYRGVLDSGVALFNVSKLRAKENIEAQAPTAVAGVRGTGFLFSFIADTAVASVQEGKLSMRPALGIVENQSGGLLGQSRTLTGIYDSMQKDAVNIDSGQTSSWSRSDIDQRYQAASSVIDLIAKANPQADTTQLVKSLDEQFGAIKYKVQPPRQAQSMETNAISLIGQSLLGLVPVDTKVLSDAVNIGQAISQRNQANQIDLLAHMGAVKQQRIETLILKDGRQVRGLIFEQGGAYLVESPMGTQVFPRYLVEGYAF